MPGDFSDLAAELVAETLAASPLLASAVGRTEHDGLLPDVSESAVAGRARRDDEWLERLDALPDTELTLDDAVDRDLARMALRGRRAMRDWASWRRDADTYAGAALQGVFVLLLHRLHPEPELARLVGSRLRAAPELLEQGIANLDPELASPELLRRSLGMVAAGAAYARSVAGDLAPEHRSEVAEAGELAAAAFERFGAHVSALAERASGTWAIGEARYDALLCDAEGLGYGAREMRERGQRAYDELDAEMRELARGMRGVPDWRAAIEAVNADAPDSPEEMLALYREATGSARSFAAEHDLVTLPAGERCEVVPSAPFNRGMLAVAHYIAPPPFQGGGVGHFFVPYPPEGASPEQVRQRLLTNSREALWSVAVHEAYPGHHWHFATLAAGGLVRRPLRAVLGSAYFVEGWGLYAEDVMREQGFFTTPGRLLAQRDARIWRAARIVVDTSLHLGEMSIEQATEHMSTKASLSPETARAEVLRYCAMPTQASSYLTGALEIARLRRRWEAEGRGSLREFHDRAAATGRLPVPLVERLLFPEDETLELAG
ncbi:DUF885 domain-containing protein [Motilibacter peucedani]|uniref:DUF885 domain-containing protein n=1 Tax=Motilibacter peucedani TaxID=598650 RepID=UPI00160266FC|nr:DUF885 domain-containing protein [Motilibacter peucedani]